MRCIPGVHKILCCVFTFAVLSACGPETDDTDFGDGNQNSDNNPQTFSCDETDSPYSPLRRLTRFEYRNSVEDLLLIDAEAVGDLPADSSDGFDNNAELQLAPELLVEKYVIVSETLASEAIKNLDALSGCNPQSIGAETCAQEFAQSFGQRAFRRPLSDADIDMFMSAYHSGADGGNHQEGIEVMIRMALQSPNFLYRLEQSGQPLGRGELIQLTDFELATRLSYFLWGTTPNEDLLELARQGKLSTKAEVEAQARKMLKSPKAQTSITNFLAQWSEVNKLETITKNTELFPNYSSEVKKAMQRELPAFVQYMLDENKLTLETLFTSNKAFVSGPLADIYGVGGSIANTIREVTLPSEQGRAGLLTQAGFLSVQGHPDQTSPVLRGQFVRAQLLCNPPPPPPDNVDISVPEVGSAATARERASMHLDAGGGCAGCHTLMDPIGLAFEHFDAMGQFRSTENGHDIDVNGEVTLVNDTNLEGEFEGVRELAEKLSRSELVQSCVSKHMFRFATGRFEGTGDSCSMKQAEHAFIESDGDFIELMVAITQTDAFLYRTEEAQ